MVVGVFYTSTVSFVNTIGSIHHTLGTMIAPFTPSLKYSEAARCRDDSFGQERHRRQWPVGVQTMNRCILERRQNNSTGSSASISQGNVLSRSTEKPGQTASRNVATQTTSSLLTKMRFD